MTSFFTKKGMHPAHVCTLRRSLTDIGVLWHESPVPKSPFMYPSLLNALFLLSAQILLFVGLPAVALTPVLRGRALAKSTLVAGVAGIGTASLWGTLLVLTGMWAPGPGLGGFAGGWLVTGVALWRPSSCRISVPIPRQPWLWAVLLVSALISRLLHPLSTQVLGQSDAYTHLEMVRGLIDGSGWRGGYPPAYAVLMSFPGLFTGLDATTVMRFGGAFFGIGLVVSAASSVAWVSRERLPALITAALIGSFPGFLLLAKTGVGAFPNQAGLCLLPVLFASAVRLPEKTRLPRILFCCSGISLLLLVPMMLLHVAVILILFFFVTRRFRFRRSTFLLAGAAGIVGIALLIAGTFTASPMVTQQTLLLTSGDEAGTAARTGELHSITECVGMVTQDFFSLKRLGLGSAPANAATLILASAFAGCVATGLRVSRPGLTLLGLWGGVTLLQTATGMLQFTAYQREGWSLLLATAILGGVLAFRLVRLVPVFERLVTPGLLCVCILGLWMPPRHVPTTSTAEEELIRIVQEIAADPDRPEPLYILTRPFPQEAFPGVMIPANPSLTFSASNSWMTYKDDLNRYPVTLMLLDPVPEALEAPPSGFSSVSPEMAEKFAGQQQRSLLFNETLLAYAQQLDPEKFEVTVTQRDHGVRTVLVRHRTRNP